MTENKKVESTPSLPKETKLPCGCIYQEKSWMLTRVNECADHKRIRTRKRPYRPKAECVRP